MKVSEIKPGTLLEIYIRRDGYNYKVISKVEYVDDQRVGVTPIASRTRLFKFKSTDIVDIVYRMDDKSWKWSKVKARAATLKDGTQLHVFIPDTQSEVFNRRTTYRLPMSIDIDITYEVVEYKTLSDEAAFLNSKTPDLDFEQALSEISESYREYRTRAHLRDISEGGAAILTDIDLKKGDIVSFELPYNDETVKCRALVIRNMATGDKQYPHSYGLSFIETSGNYVSYFFAEQRKMLSENKSDYNF